ncbi:hypothetical protein FACS189440_08700 [Bacteroidia bacterium]|nr:hypothetical protein FACS189423_09760 [Bacteroidia bacterium]GHT47628.1 hypothetical protein FACS189440_08700 [Bacteroidia bacterium]
MKLQSFIQVNNLNADFVFDIFIASCGYEPRASFLAQQGLKAQKQIVLAFEDNQEDEDRIHNDQIFEKLGFEFIKMKGSEYRSIFSLFESFIKDHTSIELSILIDYSSMTRMWYGAIVYFLTHLESSGKKIHLYLSYSVSTPGPPPEVETETLNFHPIDLYCQLSLPTKPTALIAGLGYEKKRIFGLREYFDAEALFLFYTDGNPFTKDVLKKNEEVLKSVKEENIFPYTLTDLNHMKMLLQDLCEDLKNDFRVIIAPCGPKPFTLLSFVIASQMPNIDVWRISAGDDENQVVKSKASGKLIIAELIFEDAK